MAQTLALKTALLAEALGTAGLLLAVVGSGIMAERLADGNVALALLCNALATAGALSALIHAASPYSGAHFNPAVTLALAVSGRFRRDWCVPYIAVQVAAAVLGVCLAHALFELPLLQFSQHARTGPAQWLSEGVATLGLLLVVFTGQNRASTGNAVAAYVLGAYFFTSSTAFANPAVTLARAFTDTFAGIRPQDVLGFVAVQAGVALVFGWLMKKPSSES
jgi:glycerol uptake facilitator-like aquaporin